MVEPSQFPSLSSTCSLCGGVAGFLLSPRSMAVGRLAMLNPGYECVNVSVCMVLYGGIASPLGCIPVSGPMFPG